MTRPKNLLELKQLLNSFQDDQLARSPAVMMSQGSCVEIVIDTMMDDFYYHRQTPDTCLTLSEMNSGNIDRDGFVLLSKKGDPIVCELDRADTLFADMD
ncbi:MAG: hypothetical protein EOO02_07700 [Chitinophagaceae bacterium]|nr:MAG: hypothetical protein EOO02_07700 [Chitinophagaceae bacterium]